MTEVLDAAKRLSALPKPVLCECQLCGRVHNHLMASRPPSSKGKIIPGRCYFTKRIGWRWQVWFTHSDESADPASGATEWMAISTKFWRWRSAARIANEIWSSFNDGVFIQRCRFYDAERAAHAPAAAAITEEERDAR